MQVRNVIPGSFEMRCKAPIDDRDDSRPRGETVSWYGIRPDREQANNLV
jgi:hypothetical protein